jgi:hypothetical protein
VRCPDVLLPCHDDIETKEVVDGTIVCALRLCIQTLLEQVKCRSLIACDELIIHMDGDQHGDIILLVDMETWVCTSGNKAFSLHPLVKGLVETAR